MSRTRAKQQGTRWLTAALLVGTLACSDSSPPTLPPPPAEPTGTLLLRDPSGIMFTLEAGTATPREISRFGDRFNGGRGALLPGGMSIVGMGVARNGIPRGLRRFDLAEGGELTTLAELDEIAWTFTERSSPDGKMLAFAASNWVFGKITLMQMDLATREVEQLWVAAGIEADETEFARFHWLPDRSALIGQLWGLNRFRLARFDMATRTMTTFSDWMGADVLPQLKCDFDRPILWSTEESMSPTKRRSFTADEKATILRRHLADKIPVSDLCDEYRIQPSLLYLWQRQAFENLGLALEDRRTRRTEVRQSATQQRTIEKLQSQLQQKDAVIAFVSEEHLSLKKRLFRKICG